MRPRQDVGPRVPEGPPRRRADQLALAAVAVPAVVLAVVAARARSGPWGDQGAIQLATDRAAHFSQLLGPYSRFGWSHPGALWFYLLAAPYRLFGGTGRGLVAATVVLTGAAALAVVSVAGRLGGRPAARWAAAVVVVEMAALGPGTVAEVWNPVAIIVPTTLFLTCCAGVMVGRWGMLTGAVGVGSFLVQTDVSTGAVVAVVGAAAVGGGLAVRRRGAGGSGERDPGGESCPLGPARFGRAAVASGCLALLLWLAPVVQQLTGSPGNLGRVVSFFRSGAPGHPVGAAARAVAGALWPPLHGRFGAPPGAGASAAIVIVTLAVAASAMAIGLIRRRPLAAALAGAGALAVVVGVASATRATGPLYGYLTEWLSAAPAVILLGLLLAVSTPEEGTPAGPGGGTRLVSAPEGAGACLAAAALVVLAVVQPPASSAGGLQVDQLWAAARRALPPAGGREIPVKVAVTTPDRWPWAAGLLVDVEHAGYRPVAPPAWLFLFGTQLAYRGRPAAVVSVWRPGSGPPPAGRQVAVAGATAVFVSSP